MLRGVSKRRLAEADRSNAGRGQFLAYGADRAKKRDIQSRFLQGHRLINGNATGPALHVAEVIQDNDGANNHATACQFRPRLAWPKQVGQAGARYGDQKRCQGFPPAARL